MVNIQYMYCKPIYIAAINLPALPIVQDFEVTKFCDICFLLSLINTEELNILGTVDCFCEFSL